jgi:Glycosyltransferase family 87
MDNNESSNVSHLIHSQQIKPSLKKRIIFLAGCIMGLILVVFLLQTFGKAYRAQGYDFTSYMLSSKAFFEGANPYQTATPFSFIYPLFVCLVLMPFAMLPYWLSNLLWFIGNALALYLSAVTLIDLYAQEFALKFSRAVWFFPFIILVNVIQNNLLNGQINFIVLLLCVAFLKAHLESRRLSSSIYLAAAVSIKLTPLILLVYLIFRKDFLTVGLVLLISSIMAVLLPYFVDGAAVFQYYSYYISSFLSQSVSSSGQAPANFFSITAIFNSLFSMRYSSLSIILASILSLTPIVLVQLRSHPSTKAKETVFFSSYLLAALLISPVSETHHLIGLFPALLVITLAALQNFQNTFRVGVSSLIVIAISLLLGRFLFPLNIIAIASSYVSMVWLIRALKKNDPFAPLDASPVTV